MFNCKCCQEKNNHIESLKMQIKFLQDLANPQASKLHESLINLEANKILDGGLMPVLEVDSNISKDKQAELLAIEKEANNILMGNF